MLSVGCVSAESGQKRLFISPSAQARQERAARWLSGRREGEQVLVVAFSQVAAAEIARSARRPATFGWHRFSLDGAAAAVASQVLAARRLVPVGELAIEALCARVVHACAGTGELGRLQPLVGRPGLARALARTLGEIRLAGIAPDALRPIRPELADLLRIYEAELSRARLADRATVLALASERIRDGIEHPILGHPLLLADLSLQSALERNLVAALARRTGDVLAVVPASDALSVKHLGAALEVAPEEIPAPGPGGSLDNLQRHLFSEGAPVASPPGDEVVVFSAPGEGRECVEIARRIQREAARGVPFDRMAILLRAPTPYRPLLEEALRRAGVPAWFARGALQPDPAGRAFLSLLACAAEGLSARRFAEYLSLGEVPLATSEGTPPAAPPSGERWVPPDDELVALLGKPEEEEAQPEDDPHPAPDAPVQAGTLRAPWRWEELLVEAAVIGGRDRWARRLEGLRREFELKLADLEEAGDAATDRVRRELSDLESLRRFALPLLEELAALPPKAPWGEWLDALSALASRALRRPDRVQALLAELSPMAPVGPVEIGEVQLVLGRRLAEVAVPPAGHRYGKVFVAPVALARGLCFDAVFVPGLSERLFPQKILPDPLLRDPDRQLLAAGLKTNEDRGAAERLALAVAAGAAAKRIYLSYPRLDLQQARPRVPSFYALEVLRAAEGRLPGFNDLARRAEQAGGARIGWPAPREAADSIDEAEYDLALLHGLLHEPPEKAKGAARYLLAVNPALARSLRARARRWKKRWTPADGLVDPSPAALAAISAHTPSARSFSATALQHYAACPYRFLLQAIHRLERREEPKALEEIDPLTRGSLIHETQFELLDGLRAAGLLPITPANLEEVRSRLEDALDAVARRYRDDLAPAIERVWEDGIAAIRADLREWLLRASQEAEWEPWRFELAFGLPERRHRDPASRLEPVVLEEGFSVRGSIDLVERAPDGALRATDYKTGKVRAEPGMVIGGGKTLQPALYALALEQLFPGTRVKEGRLYYSSFTGSFTAVGVPLDRVTRESVKTVATTIGEAVRQGFLPAAPAEGECAWCDYLAVCDSSAERRAERKPTDRIAPLVRLRGMP
ncbi:MAG: PD-(D/E)XK nuclease family protein [Deltaproteobacteria bacterium]|nr:MAG: PD-(D/E)XK nuclease family protein [Deltaproteobacteria bacterium]